MNRTGQLIDRRQDSYRQKNDDRRDNYEKRRLEYNGKILRVPIDFFIEKIPEIQKRLTSHLSTPR